jgi:hypothetical protein
LLVSHSDRSVSGCGAPFSVELAALDYVVDIRRACNLRGESRTSTGKLLVAVQARGRCCSTPSCHAGVVRTAAAGAMCNHGSETPMPSIDYSDGNEPDAIPG